MYAAILPSLSLPVNDHSIRSVPRQRFPLFNPNKSKVKHVLYNTYDDLPTLQKPISSTLSSSKRCKTPCMSLSPEFFFRFSSDEMQNNNCCHEQNNRGNSLFYTPHQPNIIDRQRNIQDHRQKIYRCISCAKSFAFLKCDALSQLNRI